MRGAARRTCPSIKSARALRSIFRSSQGIQRRVPRGTSRVRAFRLASPVEEFGCNLLGLWSGSACRASHRARRRSTISSVLWNRRKTTDKCRPESHTFSRCGSACRLAIRFGGIGPEQLRAEKTTLKSAAEFERFSKRRGPRILALEGVEQSIRHWRCPPCFQSSARGGSMIVFGRG
jgi:hypothetical protein